MANDLDEIDLPPELRRYFWDHGGPEVDRPLIRHTVVVRLLQAGGLDAVRWLRSSVGDDEVRHVLHARHGRGIDPKRLRFWELILDLPREEVDEWIEAQRSTVWHERTFR